MAAHFKVCALLAVMVGMAWGDCVSDIAGKCPDGYTSSNGQCCSDSLVLSTTASPTGSNTTGATTTTTKSSTSSGTCADKTKADGTSDCAALAYLCNDSIYYTLMTEQCPKTCGRCSGSGSGSSTSAPSGNCADKTKPDGTSDCVEMAYLCNNSVYYDLMTEQCPKTCGRCSSTPTPSTGTSGACVDLSAPGRPSDCPARASLCHNSIYAELMKQQCPKTCGYCSASAASTPASAVTVITKASTGSSSASTTASPTAATTTK